jgi:2-oxoglutarate ferredoxin oxidoreductase subunit gamma
MLEKIIIAGAGGQGIMLLGKILTEAAMNGGKEVTWLPTYGPEVRGGTASCMIVVSDQKIGSPFVDKADTLIVMNEPSLVKFKSRLKSKGLLLVNSSLAESEVTDKNLRVLKFPFTGVALELGNIKVANVVALGSYTAETKVINPNMVIAVMRRMAPQHKKDLLEINKQALYRGMELVKNA